MTVRALVLAYLRDMVTDIRCAERDGMEGYAQSLRQEFRHLWRRRHSVGVDRYGVPRVGKIGL